MYNICNCRPTCSVHLPKYWCFRKILVLSEVNEYIDCGLLPHDFWWRQNCSGSIIAVDCSIFLLLIMYAWEKIEWIIQLQPSFIVYNVIQPGSVRCNALNLWINYHIIHLTDSFYRILFYLRSCYTCNSEVALNQIAKIAQITPSYNSRNVEHF